jgi:hypothetical protein
MEHFMSGSTGRCAGELVNMNKNIAAYFFHRLREIICQATEEGGVRFQAKSKWIRVALVVFARARGRR